MLRYTVPPEWGSARLDLFLQACIPRLSRAKARQIIEACAYRADGSPRRASDRVSRGECVTLVRPRLQEPELPEHLELLYEDTALLCVDKPAHLPVHPSASYHRYTLTHWLRAQRSQQDWQLGHRLDRETSGVLACGLGGAAAKALKQGFEHRRVQKRYLALVEGDFASLPARIDSALGRARNGPHYVMEVYAAGEEGAKPALTELRCLAQGNRTALVALWPRTGRQHQLRVHLASIGAPIVGDKLYGPEGHHVFEAYVAGLLSDDGLALTGASRHMLHASGLRVAHPLTAEDVEIEAPLPDDFRATWLEREGQPLAPFVAAGLPMHANEA